MPKMANNLSKNSKSESIWHDKTTYHCAACGATYKRDNPDLAHCEYCNNKLIDEEEID